MNFILARKNGQRVTGQPTRSHSYPLTLTLAPMENLGEHFRNSWSVSSHCISSVQLGIPLTIPTRPSIQEVPLRAGTVSYI